MHISDIKKFLRCPRMYQLSQNDSSQQLFSYFNITIDVDQSIRNKFSIASYYTGASNEQNSDSFAAMKNYEWLFKTRFVYRGLRVKVPLMHVTGSGIDLYFIQLAHYPTEEASFNISCVKEVLNKVGVAVNNIYLIHFNKNYIRQGELDDDALWIVSDTFYTYNGTPTRKVCDVLASKATDIDIYIDSLLHFDDMDMTVRRTSKCTGRNKCQYYDICFSSEKSLPDDTILSLVNSQFKYQMYEEGIRYLSQVDLTKFEGSNQQYAQIMAGKNKGLFVDRIALKNYVSNISYPISFIDFEWDLYAVPPYDSMRPIQVVVFQYSLHVLQEDGSIEHYQYIGEGDCRREFCQSLFEKLPERGTVFAYNAKGAEVLRLQELAGIYPEYRERLDMICSRFEDLAVPFINGMIYDVRMKGSYSLKSIQSIIDQEHSYKQLEVENGLEAVDTYRLLVKCGDPEKKKEYYDQLYKYCGLDSYALYEVYIWLINKLKEKPC